MNPRRFRKAAPLILEIGVIPLGIVLLQAHGIPFWVRIVGLHTGVVWLDWAPAVLWSGALEWLNVWRWGFKRGWVLGSATALLLVTGPLIEVGLPLYQSWRAEEAAPLLASEAERRLSFYRALAEKRSGWQDDLRKAESEALTASRVQVVRLPLIHIIRTLMLLLTLLIFAGAVPMALRSLNERARARSLTILERVQAFLRERPAPAWMSPELKESILTHYERELAGRKVLSAPSIARLARRLGVL